MAAKSHTALRVTRHNTIHKGELKHSCTHKQKRAERAQGEEGVKCDLAFRIAPPNLSEAEFVSLCR